jgi:hypothetical protein
LYLVDKTVIHGFSNPHAKGNKVDEKGEMPLYIRIIKGRKAKFISLGIKVHPNLWNQEKLRVKGQYPHSGRVNALIAKKLAEAEAAAIDMETKEKYVSSKKIKEAIMGKPAVSLFEYANQYISDNNAKGKVGTYKNVKSVLFKLQTFLKSKDLNFDDFDLPFLKRYEHYLRDDLKNKQNTIHANLKIFRMLFNSAIREELIEPQLSPFIKFKLLQRKQQKTI